MEISEYEKNLDEERKLTEWSIPKEKEKVTLDHFTLLSVIGKGSYAKVALVRKKDTKQVMALKILKKTLVDRKNQKAKLSNERQVMIDLKHPFIIKLYYAFQSERKLFFAMEFCHGGELFNLLQKRRVFNEAQARFYAAQILLALEYLHSKDIIYRDLKPENVLIDKDGYIRLCDFGLSKRGIKGSNKGATTICGTPEYLAPELLLRPTHGKAVDWWTFGAIIYEMLTGLPPFYTTDREELFDRIKFATLRFPPNLSANAKDLLERLFVKDPAKRFGSGPDGAEEIKNHPWFDSCSWDLYLKKEARTPFVPKISDETDTSNFNPEFTETPVETLRDSAILDKRTDSFSDWSYDPESMKDLDSKGNRDSIVE